MRAQLTYHSHPCMRHATRARQTTLAEMQGPRRVGRRPNPLLVALEIHRDRARCVPLYSISTAAAGRYECRVPTKRVVRVGTCPPRHAYVQR